MKYIRFCGALLKSYDNVVMLPAVEQTAKGSELSAGIQSKGSVLVVCQDPVRNSKNLDVARHNADSFDFSVKIPSPDEVREDRFGSNF